MTQQHEAPPGSESPEGSEARSEADQRQGTDWVVFGVGAGLAVVFVLWGIISTDTLSSVSSAMLDGIIKGGGWFFILAATGFVVFALWLAFSRVGRIRLGADDEKPQFKTISWIAMMFSAGMGIGLMYFGVAEPLSFFNSPPPGSVAAGDQVDALRTAMATSLFHWTLHPWSIYAVVGLAIAYSTFRKGRRQLISSAFIPLIGEKAAMGAPGKVIDIVAIFATIFGSAASLGLGALQIRGGLDATGILPGAGNEVLVPLIVVLTAAFVLSAVSGVAKGIQWLSNTNMVLAGVLTLFVFVVGPTVIILDLFPTAVGAYIGEFGEMVGRTEATGGAPMLEWLSGWTVFYWAWWISWAPFVGMFLAKISRGRTIREFVGGVILVPSLVSLVWFSVYGGTAITLASPGGARGPGGAAGPFTSTDTTTEVQLFEVLQAYPLATVTGLLVMVLVAIFFVSGADAASIVTGTLSQRGTDEPQRWVVIFWGSVMGAVAIIMLLTGGQDALDGLQNLTILVAAPFVVIMVMLCVAFVRDLRHDPIVLRDHKTVAVMEQAVDYGTDKHGEAFYLSVGAFPPDATWHEVNDDGETVTYARVRTTQDPFRGEDAPADALAESKSSSGGRHSATKDGDPGGTEITDTGPGEPATREHAGRPSAERD